MTKNLKLKTVFILMTLLPGCTLIPDSQTAQVLPVQAHPGSLITTASGQPDLTSEKTVLLFSSLSCDGCAKFIQDAQANLGRIPAETSIRVVDFDTNLELKQKYQVESPHTFIQVDRQGNPVHRWTGCETLADFVKNIY